MRRLLLDTHVWLWIYGYPEKVSRSVQRIMDAPDAQLFVSLVSLWEVSIKFPLGKLELPAAPEEYVPARLAGESIELLPITLGHVLAVASLPLHHGDPFDRLLIAQARTSNLEIVTTDGIFDRYDVRTVSA